MTRKKKNQDILEDAKEAGTSLYDFVITQKVDAFVAAYQPVDRESLATQRFDAGCRWNELPLRLRNEGFRWPRNANERENFQAASGTWRNPAHRRGKVNKMAASWRTKVTELAEVPPSPLKT